MDYTTITNVLTIVVVILALLLIYRAFTWYGILGGHKAASKAVEDKKNLIKAQKARKRMTWIMAFLERISMMIGGGIKPTKETKYMFYIVRREMTIKTLGRQWKPVELDGLFKGVTYLGVVLGTVGLSFMQFNILWLFYGLIFIPMIFTSSSERALIAEDKELEQDFPDLYLLLNPKLQMGSSARIATVLSDYMVSLDHSYAKTEHLAIKKFVRLLRTNIELFSDEVLALQRVRRFYKSATIINFCNVAMQALNGVDNKEKLIAFEQELTRQKMDLMRRRAQKLVEKGQKAVLITYIILFEFVAITIYSRIGGNLDALLGIMG